MDIKGPATRKGSQEVPVRTQNQLKNANVSKESLKALEVGLNKNSYLPNLQLESVACMSVQQFSMTQSILSRTTRKKLRRSIV